MEKPNIKNPDVKKPDVKNPDVKNPLNTTDINQNKPIASKNITSMSHSKNIKHNLKNTRHNRIDDFYSDDFITSIF
jgi:hypothetical protein